MGEIAEMMLDGTLCEGCGEYLGNGDDGFAQLCAGCAREQRKAGEQIRDTGFGTFQNVTPVNQTQDHDRQKIACKQCGKKVKRIGMSQHVKAVHKED